MHTQRYTHHAVIYSVLDTLHGGRLLLERAVVAFLESTRCRAGVVNKNGQDTYHPEAQHQVPRETQVWEGGGSGGRKLLCQTTHLQVFQGFIKVPGASRLRVKQLEQSLVRVADPSCAGQTLLGKELDIAWPCH